MSELDEPPPHLVHPVSAGNSSDRKALNPIGKKRLSVLSALRLSELSGPPPLLGVDFFFFDGSILFGLLEKGTIADIRAPLRFIRRWGRFLFFIKQIFHDIDKL